MINNGIQSPNYLSIRVNLFGWVFTWVLLVTFAVLSVVEFTERRALESADLFLGPTLGVLQWKNSHLSAFRFFRDFHSSKTKLHGPTWEVTHENRSLIEDWPPTVYVDLLGNVYGSNTELLDGWILLSKPERVKHQLEALAELTADINKEHPATSPKTTTQPY